PRPRRQPADATRECCERFNTVFIAILGVNGFTCAEVDGFSGDFHFLAFEAGKVHFNTMPLAIVKCMMLESIEPEGAAKLAIDAGQQIEIELGRNACLIVVSSVEHLHRLDQIDSDDQGGTPSKNVRGIA